MKHIDITKALAHVSIARGMVAQVQERTPEQEHALMSLSAAVLDLEASANAAAPPALRRQTIRTTP